MSLTKYGEIKLLRARGVYRRMSIVGSPKVVFSSSDDMIQSTKTIVLVSGGAYKLTLDEKKKILDAFDVHDNPEKVIWALEGEVSIVKDPYSSRITWKYLPIQGFSYMDQNVLVYRKMSFVKGRPSIEYVIGGVESISEEQIQKEDSSNTSFAVFMFVLFLVIPLLCLIMMGAFGK